MNSKQPPSQGDLRTSALDYHRVPSPGKIAVVPTKQLTNQYDLALAYSPGVAADCGGGWRQVTIPHKELCMLRKLTYSDEQ